MSKNEVACVLGNEDFRAKVQGNEHEFYVDEPESVGGGNSAATPTEHLLGALASCTAITIKMYAKRKGWDIGEVNVKAQLINSLPQSKEPSRIRKMVSFRNKMTDKEIERLLFIGEKCPVSKLLAQDLRITTEYL